MGGRGTKDCVRDLFEITPGYKVGEIDVGELSFTPPASVDDGQAWEIVIPIERGPRRSSLEGADVRDAALDREDAAGQATPDLGQADHGRSSHEPHSSETGAGLSAVSSSGSKVRVCVHARVVGVAFWDRPHTVIGRAPNSIELHPILDFACLSG